MNISLCINTETLTAVVVVVARIAIDSLLLLLL